MDRSESLTVAAQARHERSVLSHVLDALLLHLGVLLACHSGLGVVPLLYQDMLDTVELAGLTVPGTISILWHSKIPKGMMATTLCKRWDRS